MQKHIKFYSVSKVSFLIAFRSTLVKWCIPPFRRWALEGLPYIYIDVICVGMCIYMYITCLSKLILCWWKHHVFVDAMFLMGEKHQLLDPVGNQALLPTAEMLQHVEGPYTAMLQVASWWLLVQSDFLTNWEVYQISSSPNFFLVI